MAIAALSDKMIKVTEDILIDWANAATIMMRNNLRRNLKQTAQESLLAQSIVFDGTKVNSEGISLFWELNDYWMYIDLGVKGVTNRSKTYTSIDYPSGFQFKNLGVPPQMAKAMQSYIARKGLPVNNKPGQSKLEASHQMAYGMSKAVKKKGITGTRFYSDVFNGENFKKLTDKLAEAWGTEVELELVAEIKK